MRELLHILTSGHFRQRIFTAPEDAKCPKRYRALVANGFYVAARALIANGIITSHQHDIRKIKPTAGNVYDIRKGWGVKWRDGSVAAAWKGPGHIGFAVDPDTGAENPGRAPADLAHEWGHAFLDKAKIALGQTDKQHDILRGAWLAQGTGRDCPGRGFRGDASGRLRTGVCGDVPGATEAYYCEIVQSQPAAIAWAKKTGIP